MKGSKIRYDYSLFCEFFYYENNHFLFSQPPLSIFWCHDPQFLMLYFFLFACMVALAKRAINFVAGLYHLCSDFVPLHLIE